jgi:ATP-dependent Clp protease ATP-binding subunit ClpC
MVPGEGRPGEEMPPMELSEHVVEILLRAIDQASSEGSGQAAPDDILAAFLADGGGAVGQQLQHAISGGAMPIAVVPVVSVAQGERREEENVLEKFGVDLTARAREGKLPRIVGRDREIDVAVRTLLLTESANPLLVGEAGVGKTAIVHGIAQQLAGEGCPAKLRDMRLIELSAGSLVSNTTYRGEFEERIRRLLVEAREKVILFIDEIHTIVGAGSGGGASLDAGNMLKSALSGGEIRLIGATTPGEFRRHIAQDDALSRRFQELRIEPPSRDATLIILRSRQGYLEQEHGVQISDEAMVAATDLSGRYIVDKQWPAKARDALDSACAIAAMAGGAASAEAPAPTVTAEHVAKAVSEKTGVPLERVAEAEQTLLATLEERIGKRIIGQSHAVKIVADAIRRGRHGLGGPGRPWGVFLFVGPPGVGKTELAKVLAEEVYGGAEGLIRFDMNDFSEPHATAKLLGAPPGYVGYWEGAPLVERLHKRPYSLLLFDEIDHAHVEVQSTLLRLLSEGTITGTSGDVGDARNCIIIMTTNALDPERNARMGFGRPEEPDEDGPSDAELRPQVERFLERKLVDRIDSIVSFRPLSREDLAAIARLRIDETVRQAPDFREVRVTVAEDVLTWLVDKIPPDSAAARGVQRAVDTYISGRLGDFLVRAIDRGVKAVRIALDADGEAVAITAEEGP